MPMTRDRRLEMRTDEETLAKLDDLCNARREARIPSRSDVLHQLIDEAWQRLPRKPRR